MAERARACLATLRLAAHLRGTRHFIKKTDKKAARQLATRLMANVQLVVVVFCHFSSLWPVVAAPESKRRLAPEINCAD